MNIEPLESRIAPASLINTDVDGDLITITISKVTVNDIAGAILLSPAMGKGQQILTLNLRDPKFEGVNVSITATPDPALGGDGTVNVGYIDANGRDLGTVFVEGDLGVFDAGDPTKPASACKGLTVHSLGVFGTSTGAPSLVGIIDGRLDKLTVKFDVKDASLRVTDSVGTNGKVGSVFIGGSLIGGAADFSGYLTAQHGFGMVTIKGDIVGGVGTTSGAIDSTQDLAGLSLGGSLVGGTGPSSGVVFSQFGKVGPVKIGGDVRGGSAVNTGRVFAKTQIESLSLAGSLAGVGIDSGMIHSDGVIGPVKIGQSIIGGFGSNSATIAATTLGTVTIGGSLVGGVGADSGKIASGTAMGAVKIGKDINGGRNPGSGAVDAGTTLASVTVGGSLLGGEESGSGSIFSGGAMGAVKVSGDIVAGASNSTGVVRSMGTLAGVTLGGSLIGESRSSSAGSQSGEIHSEGNMGPVKIAGSVVGGGILQSGHILSKGTLASVTIGGSLVGGGDPGTGEIFSAAAMGPVKIGGDIVGGFASGPGGATGGAGYIEGLRIASLFVGGSIRASVDDGFGFPTLTKHGSVRAVNDIGPITIKGSLIGSADTDSDPADGDFTSAVISAGGQAGLPAGAKNDVAIKSIRIGGRVEFAHILAGFDLALQPKNGDAQIGAITVGGDWISSNLIAGVTSINATFGDADDLKMTGAGVKDDADLGGNGAISKIAAVIIKGRALGTAASSDLTIFGIEAQQLVSIKIAGFKVALTTGAGNDLHASRRPLSATFDAGGDFDFNAFEVA